MHRHFCRLFRIVLLLILFLGQAAVAAQARDVADRQILTCSGVLNSTARLTVENAETEDQILQLMTNVGLFSNPLFSQALTATLADYGVSMPKLKGMKFSKRFKRSLEKTIIRLNDDPSGVRFANFTMRILDHISEQALDNRRIMSLVDGLSARYHSGGQIKAPVARVFQDIAKQTLLALGDFTGAEILPKFNLPLR